MRSRSSPPTSGVTSRSPPSTADADGLDVVRRVVDDAARVLRPGGWLVVEVGGTQDDALEPELAARGFAAATTWRDADGDLRGMAARRVTRISG